MAALSLNQRHALIVRIGEKRILKIYLRRILEFKVLIEEESETANNKRKAADDQGRSKKEKRMKTD
jgi:hypothetical protein